jgi:hypothetical protein
MPQVRHVLGHVGVETAAGTRICHRHRNGKGSHQISPGERCLVLEGPGIGHQNYCIPAGEAILEQAERDVARLRAELAGE